MKVYEDKGGKEYFKKIIAGTLAEFGAMHSWLLTQFVPLPEEMLLVLLKELEAECMVYQKEVKGKVRWGDWV